MIALWLAFSLAWAHGGEDHGTPPPLIATGSDAVEVVLAGERFEAAARFARGERVTVWIADTDTSAPISDGTAALSLRCETEGASTTLQLDLASTASPGTWVSTAEAPDGGHCDGVLTVTAGGATDLLEVPLVDLDPHVQATPAGGSWGAVAGAALCGILAGMFLGASGGLVIGARRRAVAAAAALLFAVAPALARAHGGEDHGEAATAPAPTGGGLRVSMASQFLLEVRTERVALRSFVDRVEAYGTLETSPGGGAEVRAPVSGRHTAPSDGVLRPGQDVQAGQVLATVVEESGAGDRVDIAAGQADASVRLAEARAALVLAERDVARVASLEGVLSERERAEREQALIVAREAVARLEVAVARSSEGNAFAIRAPVSGQLAAVMAHPGDTVGQGELMFTVVGDGALQVAARLPEALGADLVAGAAAWVVAAAMPEVVLAATVLDPGQVVDPATGMLPVTLLLADPDAGLKPGMAVRAWLATGPAREAIAVPASAVIESGGQPLVFVKTGPETFEVRPVRIGQLDGDRREVLVGLSAGERVVVSGTYVLRSLAGR